MSRIIDLQKKAQALQEQHQRNLDEKLENGMKQFFSDTESTLSEKAQNLLQSISDTKRVLEKAQSKATAEITQQIQDSVKTVKKAQDTTLQAVVTDQRLALESLQANLQQLNGLSQETALAAKLKKNLITSNIVLISAVVILLISSIALGYVSESKYNKIKEMQNQVNLLRSQGGSLIVTTCANKLCVQIDPTYVNQRYETLDTKEPLMIVKEVR